MKPSTRAPIALILMASAAAVSQDVPGSADHPLIARARDSVITWYEVQSVSTYRVAVAPVTGYERIEEWVDVEGRLTRIGYTLTSERRLEEIHSYYASAARRAGFEILTEGLKDGANVTGGIGHRRFLELHYEANPTPRGATPLLERAPSSGGSGYIAARLAKRDGDVYLVIGITQYKQDEIITLVDVIELRGEATDPVAINAGTMAKDLELHGKVALYSIEFDEGNTSVTRESKPALDEIANLLKSRPGLRLYIVVHAEMTDDLQRSVRLTQGRAESVVNALVEKYGIPRERLEPHGVGPLVPVTENESEQGRAKNRRVEIVAR